VAQLLHRQIRIERGGAATPEDRGKREPPFMSANQESTIHGGLLSLPAGAGAMRSAPAAERLQVVVAECNPAHFLIDLPALAHGDFVLPLCVCAASLTNRQQWQKAR
jgi:hypothetical protein